MFPARQWSSKTSPSSSECDFVKMAESDLCRELVVSLIDIDISAVNLLQDQILLRAQEVGAAPSIHDVELEFRCEWAIAESCLPSAEASRSAR